MKYSREAIIEKNMTLSFEFERYLLEHPNLLKDIPKRAEVVLLPKDDLQLYRLNLAAARKARRRDRATPIVFVEVDALAPARSRLINPRVKARPSTRVLTTAS